MPTRRAWWFGAAAAVLVAGAAYALLGPMRATNVAAPQTAIAPEDTAAERDQAPASLGSADPAAAPGAGTDTRPKLPDSARAPMPAAGAGAAAPPPVAPEVTVATETTVEPITANADGEAVITPETFARMQAARSLPQQTPKPAPALIPGSAPRVSEVSRPSGSTFESRRQAYGAVFERWGVDYSQSAGVQIPCDFAPSAGLQCLSGRGEWGQLGRVDLPVILELWDEQPAPYYAALLAMSDGQLQLQVGDQRLETTQRALRDQWAGSYVVLWQTPPGYQGSLRAGQTHETVGWLRQQLSGLVDSPLISTVPNRFDEGLRDAVMAFQRREGLTADGIVGPATWIRLATRLRLPQPSLAG